MTGSTCKQSLKGKMVNKRLKSWRLFLFWYIYRHEPARLGHFFDIAPSFLSMRYSNTECPPTTLNISRQRKPKLSLRHFPLPAQKLQGLVSSQPTISHSGHVTGRTKRMKTKANWSNSAHILYLPNVTFVSETPINCSSKVLFCIHVSFTIEATQKRLHLMAMWPILLPRSQIHSSWIFLPYSRSVSFRLLFALEFSQAAQHRAQKDSQGS